MTARQSAREERGAEGKTEREPTAGHKTGTPVQLMNKEEREGSPKKWFGHYLLLHTVSNLRFKQICVYNSFADPVLTLTLCLNDSVIATGGDYHQLTFISISVFSLTKTYGLRRLWIKSKRFKELFIWSFWIHIEKICIKIIQSFWDPLKKTA